MDWQLVEYSTLARGLQGGPNVDHGLSQMFTITYFCFRPFFELECVYWPFLVFWPAVFVLSLRTKQYLCCMYLINLIWSFQYSSFNCCLSINGLLASITITVTSDDLWVSNQIVLLNQKKVGKITTPTGKKTIPYPEFELESSLLAVVSHNHYNIGSVT
jgi:hypothetical protein